DPLERVAVPLGRVARLARRNEHLQVVDAVPAEREPVFHRVRVLPVAEGALPGTARTAEAGLKIFLAVVDPECALLASTASGLGGSPRLGQLGSLLRFARAPAAIRVQPVRFRPEHIELVRAERLAAT